MAKEVVVEGMVRYAADSGGGGYSPTDTTKVVDVDDSYEERDEFYCDEPKTECIDGVVYAMATGTVQHGIVMSNIARIIGNVLKGSPCKVFDGTLEYHYRFDADDETRERDYLQPDIMVCCDKSKLIKCGYYAAPKFVAEVLSPGTAKRDRGKKFKIYEETGVSEYWIVHPSGLLDIYYLINGHYEVQESWELDRDKGYKSYNADAVIALRDFPDIKMTLGEIFE